MLGFNNSLLKYCISLCFVGYYCLCAKHMHDFHPKNYIYLVFEETKFRIFMFDVLLWYQISSLTSNAILTKIAANAQDCLPSTIIVLKFLGETAYCQAIKLKTTYQPIIHSFNYLTTFISWQSVYRCHHYFGGYSLSCFNSLSTKGSSTWVMCSRTWFCNSPSRLRAL